MLSTKPRSQAERLDGLASVNPLLKIGICIVLTTVALVLKSPESLAVLVGVLFLGVVTQLQIPPLIWQRGAIALGMFALLARWLAGDWGAAALSVLRILALILPAPFLAGTTPPMDLIRALEAVRLPQFLTLSVLLVWRFLPVIGQEAKRILEANQLRGVDLSRRPTQWFSGLFVPLIFQMVAYADEVTVGLQTRGYDGVSPRSNSKPLRWRLQDTLFLIGSLGLVLVVGYVEWKS
jgi:energy-coupling factor transport system permease protein